MSEGQDLPATWDPESALTSLVLEDHIEDEQDERRAADRIFRESLPMSAKSITHLAAFGTTERIRLQASQYVVDRVMGKIRDATSLDGTEDPFLDLLGAVQVSNEEEAAIGRASSAEG
jgi:hypothetical protein